MAEWTERRTRIAAALMETLDRYSGAVRVPRPDRSLAHAYYRLYAYVRPDGLKQGWSRDRLVAELTAAGAVAVQGSCSEVYLEKAFDGTTLRPDKRLPVARELGETSLMFLTHPTLTDEEIERISNAIIRVFDRAAA